MEDFEVQLLEKTYAISPQENGTFRIFDGEEKIGLIYPEVDEDGTHWQTMDEMEQGFVAQIGELISERSL